MIKFSVIVPLYNCEKYVAECIESILSQSYAEFELIVVNDGSKDTSLNIVREYSDSRIRIVSKENGGLLHARLTGLREARNDYIVFVDADDRIRSNLLNDLEKHFSNDIDCVIYKLREFSLEGEKDEPRGVFPDKTIFERHHRQNLLKILLTSGDINSIVCKAFRKDLVSLEEMETYPRIAIGEDGLFSLQLLKNYSKLIYLDSVYYEYRQTPESMTHKLKFSNYTDNVFRFNLYSNTAIDYFKENSNEITDGIDKLFFKMLISTLINPRAYFESKSDYYDIVQKISETDVFKGKIESSLKKQNIFYKIILKCVKKKKVKHLLFFRKLFRLIYKF